MQTFILLCLVSFAGWQSVSPLPLVAPQPDTPLVRVERVEPHMGTRFQITVYAKDQQTGEKAIAAGFATIARMNKILSDYQSDSEVMRLCAQGGGAPIPVSPELMEITQKSLELSRKTEGAFDVTVGPLTLIWRRARKALLAPDNSEIEEARKKVGSHLIKLDPEKRTIQLAKKGMRLDFGGIGKGYAADKALAVIQSFGITRALVAAGGDITCSDPPPGKKGWTVELIPLPGDVSRARFFSLANGAVSTSGDLEQFLEIGGKRFSHLLNPKTGMGTTTRKSATVVSKRGADADSLTKVVLLLDRSRAESILKEVAGTSARLITPRDEVDISKGAEVFLFGEFPKLRVNPEESEIKP